MGCNTTGRFFQEVFLPDVWLVSRQRQARWQQRAWKQTKHKQRKTTQMKVNSKTASTTVEDINTTTRRLKVLYETMTFVLPLSPTERREHIKRHIGPQTLRVLGIRLTSAHQHKDLLPPAFDLRQFERDVATTAALEECLSLLGEIHQAVRDTFLVVGGRAVEAGNLAYGHIKVSAAGSDQLNRSVTRMALRSGRGSRKGAPEVAPAEPATPANPAVNPAAPAPTAAPAAEVNPSADTEPKKAA
jgi:hypothetical protein